MAQREILAPQIFVVQTDATQGMSRCGSCTPKELAQRGQKKNRYKRQSSEAEAEVFCIKIQPKDYFIVKSLEKIPAIFPRGPC